MTGTFAGNYLYYKISTEFPGEDILLISPGVKDADGISIYASVTYNFINDSLGYNESVTRYRDDARIPIPFNTWNNNQVAWDDWHVIVEYTDQAGNKEILDS